MKRLYISSLFALMSLGINAQSVGIKNSQENPTTPYTFPISSASLDTYFTQRGVLIPQYDLQELTNPTSPVDFTQDIANGKSVDGTMIFNSGGTSKYATGYYMWVKDSWHLVLYKGTEPQQLVVSYRAPKDSGKLLLKRGTAGNTASPAGPWEIDQNNIEGATVSGNRITLPKGKYAYRYTVDPVTNGSATGQYFSDFATYSIQTALRKAGTIEDITAIQRSTRLSGAEMRWGQFMFFQGLFIFELTEPTTIEQIFRYDTGTSTNVDAYIRTALNVTISKVVN